MEIEEILAVFLYCPLFMKVEVLPNLEKSFASLIG